MSELITSVDPALGARIAEQSFTVTWKECSGPGQSVSPEVYLDRFRHLAELLLGQASRGFSGLGTTRWAELTVEKSAHAFQNLKLRLWATTVSSKGLVLAGEVQRLRPGEAPERIASLAEESSPPVASANPLPGAAPAAGMEMPFLEYLSREAPSPLHDRPMVLTPSADDPWIFQNTNTPFQGRTVWTEGLRTSRMDTDSSGRVCPVTYLLWLAHARDCYLHSLVPGFFEETGVSVGEEPLWRRVRLECLRTLSSFEQVQLSVVLEQATTRKAILRFEFARVASSGLERVAIGRQELSLALLSRARYGGAEELFRALRRHVAADNAAVTIPRLNN
jgi:hypothetical protein